MPRLLLVIALFFTGSAVAQDVFTVPEVPVYAEAKNAALAQEEARAQGRKAALDLLLRRLVAEEDWIYLPNLSEEQPAKVLADAYSDPNAAYQDPNFLPVSQKRAISLDPVQVASFEQETNVFNEKSSGTTYRAEITYRFKPESIRNILRGARIPYSEEQARRAMVLPVLQTDSGVYLWEAKNPWARAWLERPLTNELTPMVLPRGDVMDTQAITAEEARELNTPALRAFAERYDIDEIYLALGRLTERDGQFRLYVQIIEATPPAIGGTSAIGTQVTEAFFRGDDDDFPALARRAVESTVQRHARQWKRRTLVDYGLQRSFELTAWFDGQAEFADIQRAINNSALVESAETQVFNRENAIMLVTVVGEEEQFDLAMQQRGLDVWQDMSERWHIANETRAAELQASVAPLTTDLDDQVERRRGIGRLFGRRDRRGAVIESDLPPVDDNEANADEGEEIPDLPDDLFGDDDQGNN